MCGHSDSITCSNINLARMTSELQIRLDWSEMDMFGHINNVAYFKYIQSARVNFWEHCALGNLISDEGEGPVLLSTECRFFVPLHYPGSVYIHTNVSFIKNTSYGIKHRLENADGITVAEANDVIVMFNLLYQERLINL